MSGKFIASAIGGAIALATLTPTAASAQSVGLYVGSGYASPGYYGSNYYNNGYYGSGYYDDRRSARMARHHWRDQRRWEREQRRRWRYDRGNRNYYRW